MTEKHSSFTVHIQGGATIDKLKAELSIGFDKEVVVLPNTNISEVNHNYILERLQDMGILSQMTLDQRNRAYNIVKREYSMPDEVGQLVDDVINQHWVEIVFGPSED